MEWNETGYREFTSEDNKNMPAKQIYLDASFDHLEKAKNKKTPTEWLDFHIMV